MSPFIIKLMQDINGVKIYNLTAGRTEAQIVQAALKKGQSLRYNQEYRNRFQLIQDFEFPSNCVQVEVTQDEQHIIAAGGYGPQMKIFEIANLSQKCMRGMDSEVVKFAIL